MAITLNYTPIPALTELSQQAGKQAGQRWQAEYQQPYDLKQMDIAAQREAQASEQQSAMERLGMDNAAALERLNLQISSSEKLHTSENQQRLKELDLNNNAAMERLQAGDYNTAQRMYAQIGADFEKLDTTISADERMLAEKNRAAMELLQAGDYKAAERLQTTIDADLKKTDILNQYQKEADYRRTEIEQDLLSVNNEYDYQKLLVEKQLNEQAEARLLQQKYDFDVNFALQKYQVQKTQEEETRQKQLKEYGWITEQIDNNLSLSGKDKASAKLIARSNIFGYDLSTQDLQQSTISEQIREQYNQGRLAQGQSGLDIRQQVADQSGQRLTLEQQKFEYEKQFKNNMYENAKQKLAFVQQHAQNMDNVSLWKAIGDINIIQKDGKYYTTQWQPPYKTRDELGKETYHEGKLVEIEMSPYSAEVNSYLGLVNMAAQKQKQGTSQDILGIR